MHLHPAGIPAPVAMELLIQHRHAPGKQLLIFTAKYIAPGHLCICLADYLGRRLQLGFTGELTIGEQVTPMTISTEDTHWQLVDDLLQQIRGEHVGHRGAYGGISSKSMIANQFCKAPRLPLHNIERWMVADRDCRSGDNRRRLANGLVIWTRETR